MAKGILTNRLGNINMLPNITIYNALLLNPGRNDRMALNIEGVTYYTMKDVTNSLLISRQTLWRWRCEGRVPLGRRFRDKQLLFTQSEYEAIEEFANRMEPASGLGPQLRLFSNLAEIK